MSTFLENEVLFGESNYQFMGLILVCFFFRTLIIHPGPGFTKGLKQKIVITLRKIYDKILAQLRLFFCLDKMGFTKGLRQNFVLDFVITLRPLQGSLKVIF